MEKVVKKGEEFSIRIPVDLLKEFKTDVRIVIRHPWCIGIPVPEALLKPELLEKFREFDIMLIPKR